MKELSSHIIEGLFRGSEKTDYQLSGRIIENPHSGDIQIIDYIPKKFIMICGYFERGPQYKNKRVYVSDRVIPELLRVCTIAQTYNIVCSGDLELLSSNNILNCGGIDFWCNNQCTISHLKELKNTTIRRCSSRLSPQYKFKYIDDVIRMFNKYGILETYSSGFMMNAYNYRTVLNDVKISGFYNFRVNFSFSKYNTMCPLMKNSIIICDEFRCIDNIELRNESARGGETKIKKLLELVGFDMKNIHASRFVFRNLKDPTREGKYKNSIDLNTFKFV